MVAFSEKHGHEYATLALEKREEYTRQLKVEKEKRELEENLEKDAVRKLTVSASADIRQSVKNLAESTSTLPDRAGYAILAFGARTDYGGGTAPFDFVPEQLQGFCERVFGIPPQMVAMKMETFLLGGGAAAYEKKIAKARDIRSDVVERLRISFGA
jgi:hypothetical protein